MSERAWWESITVTGEQLLAEVKRLVHEGNVRRIRIKHDDQIIAEFPLTIGVVGLVLAPVFAAISAMAALLAKCTIEVERVEKSSQTGSSAKPEP